MSAAATGTVATVPSSAAPTLLEDADDASPVGTAGAVVATAGAGAAEDVSVELLADPSLAPPLLLLLGGFLPPVRLPPSTEPPPSEDPSTDNTVAESPTPSSPDIEAVVDGDFLSSTTTELPEVELDW